MRLLAGIGLAATVVGVSLAGALPAFAASPLSGKVIVVDPGHGGRDPGAVANGFREKDFTLAIGTDLKNILQSQGAQVIMTRSTDVSLGATTDDDLQARVATAQNAHASAFISIHANFDGDSGVAGFTDFYGPACGFYSGATNSATDVGRSFALATAVRQAVVSQTHEADRGSIDTAFWVLGNPGIPAILAETGFISNPAEATKLANPGYQQQMAGALAQGIGEFFASGAQPATPPADALASCGPSTTPAAAPAPVEKWVQTFVPAPLLSGPDANAKQFTTLPPFSYLKVLDQQGSYLHVQNPLTNGPGYVDGSKVGPSGPPPPPPPPFSPFWVQNFVATNIWSGTDSGAVAFGPLPVFSYLEVVAPSANGRFKVMVASTGNVAYVDQAAVGPSGPPSGAAAGAVVAAAAQPAKQVTVKAGDTLFSISERLGVSMADLAAANNLPATGKIMIGQTLTVPQAGGVQPAAAAPPPAAPAPKPAATQQVTVQPGDTLGAIAGRYGTTVSALVALNQLSSPDAIQAGQTLLVSGQAQAAAAPTKPKTQQLVVQAGDTLSAIAAKVGATLDQLMSLNQLSSPDAIQAGQTLVVPA